jgi:hypothetical protein
MSAGVDPPHRDPGDARTIDTVRSGVWPQRLRRLLAGTAIVVAVVVGLSMIGIAMVVGQCDAFGGTCPAESPPLWEDDMFGTAASGALLAVAVPVFLSRPSKRRFVLALVLGIAAALFVGFIARSYGSS